MKTELCLVVRCPACKGEDYIPVESERAAHQPFCPKDGMPMIGFETRRVPIAQAQRATARNPNTPPTPGTGVR